MEEIKKLINDLGWTNFNNEIKIILRKLLQIFVVEAPKDGLSYLRKDGEWVQNSQNQSNSNCCNYSDVEIMTGGTWIDGKPTYSRTFIQNGNFSAGNFNNEIDLSSSSINKLSLVIENNIFINSLNTTMDFASFLTYYKDDIISGTFIGYYDDNQELRTQIQLIVDSSLLDTFQIQTTLKYTKTTD